MINLEDLFNYLTFLSGQNQKEIFTVAYMDRESKAPIPNLHTMFGNAEEVGALTEKLYNSHAATLHVVLNATKDKGRKASDVLYPRALALDLDRQVDSTELNGIIDAYKPHLVIETSPKKFHLYWKVSTDLKLEQWKYFNSALAAKFDGDLSLDQVQKTLRAPGVPRVTKDGNTFTPKIKVIDFNATELNLTALSARFPWHKEAVEEFKAKKEEANKAQRELLKGINKDKAPSQENINSSAKLGRNNTIYQLAKQCIAEFAPKVRLNPQQEIPTEEEVKLICSEVNEKFESSIGGPLTDLELTRTVSSGYKNGQEFIERVRAKAIDAKLQAQSLIKKEKEQNIKDSTPAKAKTPKEAKPPKAATKASPKVKTQEEHLAELAKEIKAEMRDAATSTLEDLNNGIISVTEESPKEIFDTPFGEDVIQAFDAETGERLASLEEEKNSEEILTSSESRHIELITHNDIQDTREAHTLNTHTNGILHEEPEQEEKETEVQAEVQAETEELEQAPKYGNFEGYDYTREPLATNRFTDLSVYARILQRFKYDLVRIDNRVLAYNYSTRTWRDQTHKDHPELFAMHQACVIDTVQDEQFIERLCLDTKGHFSESMKRKAEERFLSLRLQSSTSSAVLTSPEIIKRKIAEFDADEDCVYTASGLVDMLKDEKAGAIVQAEPTHYLMNQTPIIYVPFATPRKWLEFLNEVFSDAAEPYAMIQFMQELFGYSISGRISEQKIFCHYGDGSNGKSKILFALATLAGEYGTYIDPDELVKGKGAFVKSFERLGAKLESKRVAIIDDIDVSTVWNEAFIKNATSPQIRARAEYERSRVFINRCKIHLGVNVAPAPQSDNYGILRRICIIPYERMFKPDPKASDRIDNMIREEASGILNWAIEGYQRVMANGGIEYPSETLIAAEEYKENHFPIEGVLKELIEYPGIANGREPIRLSDVALLIKEKMAQKGTLITMSEKGLASTLARVFNVRIQRVKDTNNKDIKVVDLRFSKVAIQELVDMKSKKNKIANVAQSLQSL